LTLACTTPGVFFSAFSTIATHVAQVIPETGSVIFSVRPF
jgi:hypothetical protein